MTKEHYGGQAVIEGVMMRGKSNIVTSVRKEDGKIISETLKLKKKDRWQQLIFIRGIVNLIEMLYYGMKTLIWSANQFAEEGEQESLSKGTIFATVSFSILLAVGLFVALPYALTYLIGFKEESAPILFNLIDGIIKMIIFVVYLLAISFMKDIKRLFQYHGAEHKAVACYEHGKDLTVENTRKYSTRHPRCGTSFIMFVFFVSVFVFSLIPAFVFWLFPMFNELSFIMRRIILFLLRIFAIPIIASISYELLKLSDRFQNTILKVFSFPGLWLQAITTSEPDDSQIKVAINSLKKVIELEKNSKEVKK